jgi:putative DNA primase/helicase
MEKLLELDLESSTIPPIQAEAEANVSTFASLQHHRILSSILEQIQVIDFRERAGLSQTDRIENKHYIIGTVDEVLDIAIKNKWALGKRNNLIMVFNGAFWQSVDKEDLEEFLGESATRMGVNKNIAKYYAFREYLFKQFLSCSKLSTIQENDNVVKINLLNGTFEVNGNNQELRPANRRDFLTYQLPFGYNPKAKAPLFEKYLHKVLPDIERQKVLAEYLGYLFVDTKTLKLEKILMLYGGGANGKSVLFEIVNALLGKENVSNFSLHNLTNDNGYYRAKIANKLVNYASEINSKLATDIFKQLASGEPIEARLPYGEPFTITNYAKLIFNCNELPKDIEQTNAFFRRFMIIPFDVTIPEEEQDPELAMKIINNELSGIFNFVLEGLNRLLQQKGFSKSDAIQKQAELYKLQSDSVKMFIEDENYESSTSNKKHLKELFSEYQEYCKFNGFRLCSAKTVSERLKNGGYSVVRQKQGNVVYVEKKDFVEPALATPSTPLGL